MENNKTLDEMILELFNKLTEEQKDDVLYLTQMQRNA